MNSVELARAKKRSVLPEGASNTATRTPPSPPPPRSTITTTTLGSQRSAVAATSASSSSSTATATSFSSSSALNRNASFGRKAAPLPNIPAGAANMTSPKAERIAQHLVGSRRRTPADDDKDLESMLYEIDKSSASSEMTLSDPLDQLSQEELQRTIQMFGSRITPEMLRAKTGFEDLHLVTSTELLVDGRVTSGLDLIGEYMPRLVQLKLSHCRIASFRDLGTKFAALQVLQLNNAHVVDLHGIHVCSALKELYVAFNFLTELSDVSTLGCLEVLDAEGNQIDQRSEVEALAGVTSLRVLSLAGNPVERDEDAQMFRDWVVNTLPEVTVLDDVPLSRSLSGGTTTQRTLPSSYRDPQCTDLARELMVVQASIRSNVNVTNGLEAAIEDQNRKLYSRQSTSCSGARKRTPASSGGSARPEFQAERRALPQSAPEQLSPAKSTPTNPSESSSNAATASSSGLFAKNVLLRGGQATTSSLGSNDRDGGAASSLTSGGSMFSGNLVKSLRRRLPSISRGAPPPQTVVSDDALSHINTGVSVSSQRTLREHELIEKLEQMRAAKQQGQDASQEDFDTLQRILDECGLEFDLEDDSELEKMKQQELLRDISDERPAFLDKYKDLIEATDTGVVAPRGDVESASPLTEAEIVREVARMKSKTLRDAADDLVENPQTFESLKMSDLGGDVDDVL